MKATSRLLKSLLPLAGKDDHRPALNCVELKDGTLSVTNGHMMLTVPTDLKGECLLRPEDIKKLPTDCDMVAISDDSLLFVGGTLRRHLEPAQFPDLRQVVITKKPKYSIAINADVMLKFCKAMKDVAATAGVEPKIVFEFHAKDEAFGARLHGTDVSGLIMPLRLDNDET